MLIALVLSVILITVTNRVLQQYRASIEIRVGDGTVYFPPATMRTALPLWFNILNVLQMALPVVFAITALISADIVFYRVKLKKPITELQAAAGQIINNNLDFSVQYCSKDEFGRLCESFEKMRLELMKNNRELWRQMDERKRLNAAFSHDLRNPITVMKGTVKLLKKSLASDSLSPQGIRDSLLLIEEYVNRIEKYIEAMSSVQRLEEIQCSPAEVKLGEAVRELADSVRMLPALTARENIIMPLLLDKRQPDEAYLKEITDFLEISSRLSHLPCELSGGQQQRVAIARALITKPDIIFADEPTGNLDSKSGNEVMKMLKDIRKKFNKALVIITHDSRIAEMAERKFTITDGVLSEVTEQ